MACLHGWLDASAARAPGSTAIVDPGRGTITYGDLARLSDRVRVQLTRVDMEANKIDFRLADELPAPGKTKR